MIIDCTSDLHGNFPNLPGGDMLIMAGDYTANDSLKGWHQFFDWLDKQNYKKKVLVAGNHDNFCKKWAQSDDSIFDVLAGNPTFSYLCDSGIEIDGLKIWGSPWTLWFEGINPHCKAFTGSESDLEKKFDQIPDEIDILITHSPPYGIMDRVKKRNESGIWDPKVNGYHHVGSKSLVDKVSRMQTPPKLWVWGHIHEGYGKDMAISRGKPCIMVNASHVNEDYNPVNKYIRIEL